MLESDHTHPQISIFCSLSHSLSVSDCVHTRDGPKVGTQILIKVYFFLFIIHRHRRRLIHSFVPLTKSYSYTYFWLLKYKLKSETKEFDIELGERACSLQIER